MRIRFYRDVLWIILVLIVTLGPVTVSKAGIIFQDDFAGTVIDTTKWDVSVVMHNDPEHPPADAFGSYGQNDALWFDISYDNMVRGHAISTQTFTELDSVVQVEVWQDEISGWQDWPIFLSTHLGVLGYYNADNQWIAYWTDSKGELQSIKDSSWPNPEPWTHYQLKIEVEDDVLSWHIDLGDGQGYQLLYSTTDFSFPSQSNWSEQEYMGKIVLASTDIGTTYYDNLLVTPEPTTICLMGLGSLFFLRRRKV